MDIGKTGQRIARAVYDLEGLEADLRKPAHLFVKGNLNESKAKFAYSAINNYFTDNAELSRLADDKDFPKLSPQLQAQAIWVDQLMTTMHRLDTMLDKAWTIAKKGLVGQEEKILKHCKLCVKEVRTPPKNLQRVVKTMVQGEPAPEEFQPMLALLPITLICWAIADQVDEAMAKRPR